MNLTFSELMFANTLDFPFLGLIFAVLMVVIQVAKLFVGSAALQQELYWCVTFCGDAIKRALVLFDETLQTSYLPVCVV